MEEKGNLKTSALPFVSVTTTLTVKKPVTVLRRPGSTPSSLSRASVSPAQRANKTKPSAHFGSGGLFLTQVWIQLLAPWEGFLSLRMSGEDPGPGKKSSGIVHFYLFRDLQLLVEVCGSTIHVLSDF